MYGRWLEKTSKSLMKNRGPQKNSKIIELQMSSTRQRKGQFQIFMRVPPPTQNIKQLSSSNLQPSVPLKNFFFSSLSNLPMVTTQRAMLGDAMARADGKDERQARLQRHGLSMKD